jgi:hypothetical protein
MRITSNQLRRIIKQEVRRLSEGAGDGALYTPEQLLAAYDAGAFDASRLVSIINRAFPGVEMDVPGGPHTLGVYVADLLGFDEGE